jgi:hypothetical protein
MREPGDQPLPDGSGLEGVSRRRPDRLPWRPRSFGMAVLLAGAAGIAAAFAWSVLRAVLELGPGSLVVAALGGWGIGTSLRQAGGSPILAAVIGGLSWLAGLLFTWLVAMAILPGSTRTFVERVTATPFLEWLTPQLGLLEAAALVAFVGFAGWSARPATRSAR